VEAQVVADAVVVVGGEPAVAELAVLPVSVAGAEASTSRASR
jgi:hypothetical protein